MNTDEKVEKLRSALREILAWDERSMYERCPECWYNSCAEQKRCKAVPRSHIGKAAAAALEETDDA